jgi:hypothetical protein
MDKENVGSSPIVNQFGRTKLTTLYNNPTTLFIQPFIYFEGLDGQLDYTRYWISLVR